MTASLRDLRTDVLTIVRAGIAAVDAGRQVERALRASSLRGRVALIAAGKAAGPMAAAAHRALGPSIRSALVVSPAPVDLPAPFVGMVGGHPVPTAGSEVAGRRAIALAGSLSAGDTLLVLLSGGASALLALPADGVTLDDKRDTTRRLLVSGADIAALNTVRKHLSAVKGGWLAASTPARCHALVVSDVVGDDVSVIGSGPTVADASTFDHALEILRSFGGLDLYPSRAVSRLLAGARGEVQDTPKPGDPRLSNAFTTVIGTRFDAMEGAAREGAARGYHVIRIDDPVVGEARVSALAHVRNVVTRAALVDRPICAVSSGETTVVVTGGGKGGRNQEFALAAATVLASADGPAVLASVGTDGIDGPTDAAGALADTTTCARAQASGVGAPAPYLDDNDAYAFFDALGDLVTTGPTGTNVGDLQVMLFAAGAPGARRP